VTLPVPPDDRIPGQTSPSRDFDQLNDIVALLAQFCALFAGNASLPGGGNANLAANLATIQGLVASGNLTLRQTESATPFTLRSNAGILNDIFQALDPYGDILYGIGLIGPYSAGSGFFAYDRYSCGPSIAMNALVNGESGVGAGIATYAPAISPLSGSPPTGGNTINWMGVQDDWSGADMMMYVPVTTTGTSGSSVNVTMGACLVLTGALTSGSPYTSLSFQAVPGVIPNSATITLYNPGGSPTLFYAASSQAVTVTSSANNVYDATVIPVNSFNANANYPAFAPLGNGYMETTLGLVTSNNYPWSASNSSSPIISYSWPSGTPAGQEITLVFKVPNKWYFAVNATNATVGNCTGITC
jgi:hypothetical protein